MNIQWQLKSVQEQTAEAAQKVQLVQELLLGHWNALTTAEAGQVSHQVYAQDCVNFLAGFWEVIEDVSGVLSRFRLVMQPAVRVFNVISNSCINPSAFSIFYKKCPRARSQSSTGTICTFLLFALLTMFNCLLFARLLIVNRLSDRGLENDLWRDISKHSSVECHELKKWLKTKIRNYSTCS